MPGKGPGNGAPPLIFPGVIWGGTLAEMNAFTELWALAFPLLLAGGAVAAWRMSKRTPTVDDSAPKWRDDSLDDWRKERDQMAEERREKRADEPEEITGSGEEQAETKRHQRIGG